MEPAKPGMLARLGIRGRLLFAFFGISAFAVLGAGAALYSFHAIDDALALITQRRLPVAVKSQELSRHAERIVAAAPALLNATSQVEKDQWSRVITSEVDALNELLAELRLAGVESAALESLEPNVEHLRNNLQELNVLVNNRLILVAEKRGLLGKALQIAGDMQGLLAPWISVMDDRISQWRRIAQNPSIADAQRAAADLDFEKSLAWFRALQNSEVLTSSVSDLLQRAASADDASAAGASEFRLQQSLNGLEQLAAQLDPKLQSLMLTTVAQLRPFATGNDSITAMRRRELATTASGTRLLQENTDLSKQLTATVESLVTNASKDITEANVQALSVVRFSTWALAIAVVLSLISSTLIVWLYVGRSIIARLTALSDRTLTLASGDLNSPLPQGGPDEIGRMAESLAVFRATAIEMEETNLREIREARARLTDAIETISEGFSLYDAEDKLIVCNSRYKNLFVTHSDVMTPGTTFETILRTALERGLIKDAEGRREAWLAERLAHHRAATSSHIQNRSDGRWVHVNERKTAEGGVVATYADITELKQHEAELARLVQELQTARDAAQEASRTKSSFLANMSHELRTPLNAIIGVTEMLQEDAREYKRDDEVEPLDRVLRAGRHLLALINDILDLSKIEAGKMELSLETFAVAPLIDDIVKTLETLVTKNGNRVIVDCDPQVGTIYADQMRLRQALLNLASNANKFTERGTVTVAVRNEHQDDQKWIKISVSDTGIGMTGEQVGKLFQEFSQVDASTTRKYGGTGLGLAISRRFCQMMGGDIAAESEPGRGSVFTIRLPVTSGSYGAPLAPAALAASTRTHSSAMQGNAPLVLIVDDDVTVRGLIGRYLERAGFSVVTADGGQEGLRLARELHPAAITLDVMMPGIDGWTVLAAIKGDPILEDIPVILVTVMDEKSRGFTLGASEYLVKPVDRDKLTSVLRSIVGPLGRRVLLVEDNDVARKVMRTGLQQNGWEVTEAENGRIALDRLSEAKPDAIILDLMMPEMDGFEFLDELRRRTEWNDVPVIIVTGMDLTAEDRSRLNGGVERIIQKTERNAMLEEVRDVLVKCTQRVHGKRVIEA
jgi:adenylate cyclase